jgi:hypothetical protein
MWIYYGFFGAIIAFSGLHGPYHNWDIIPYSAVAKSFEMRDIGELQKFAYGELKKTVSQKELSVLVPTNDPANLRSVVAADPHAFAEQLHWYRGRIIYNLAVFVCYKLGISIFVATYLVSTVSVIAGLLLLGSMATRFPAPALRYMLPPLLILFGGIGLAKSSTPDGLAFFATVLAGYFFMTERKWPLVVTLCLLISIRTDLVFFSLPFFGAIFLVKRYTWAAAAGVTATCLLYWFLDHHFQHPGWAKAFSHIFITPLIYPMSTQVHVAVADYLRGLMIGLKEIPDNAPFILALSFAGFFIAGVVPRLRRFGFSGLTGLREVILGTVSLAYIGLHFMLFPLLSDRFFTAPYLFIVFAFFTGAAQFFCKNNIVLEMAKKQ